MDVKVCNLRSNSFVSDFRKSVTNTGFAVITHHGIDHELIKEAQQHWRLFYLNSPEYKRGFENKSDPNLGYKGMRSETAVGSNKPDLKEYFHYAPGGALPSEVSGITQQLFMQLEDLGMQVLHGLDPRYAECCAQTDNTILRVLYYPAMDFSKETGAVRAAAHEDINFITLLVAASAPGLQVMDRNGKWYDVPHEENSIVVNVGDMLQMMSGGEFKSTTHRVVNPDNSASDRISMPLFIHPHSKTILKQGFTAADYLAERLAIIHRRY